MASWASGIIQRHLDVRVHTDIPTVMRGVTTSHLLPEMTYNPYTNVMDVADEQPLEIERVFGTMRDGLDMSIECDDYDSCDDTSSEDYYVL